MKTFLGAVFGCSILVFLSACSPPTSALSASGTTDTNPPPRLTVELRDGSRVVGQSVDDTVSVHSAAIGNLKLAWATLRAIEFAASTDDAARLTATNGDGFTVQLDANTLGLKTDFGKTELPVKLIRSIKVAPPAKPTAARTTAGATDFRLTIELRDGSHLVGKGLDKEIKFNSATMGDLKLAWSGIRSVVYASEKSSTARLTTTNGDAYEVEFVTPAVRVETSFGKNELSVKSIRSIQVSAAGARGQWPEGLVALWSGENDGRDSAGSHDLTLMNVSFADGQVGRAFEMDGFSSSMKFADTPDFNPGANGDGLTISAWIKPSNVTGFHPILEWNPSDKISGQIGVQLWIGNMPGSQGVLAAHLVGQENESGVFVSHSLISRPGTVTAGSFQQVTVTYDKATGAGVLYLNGAVVTRSQWGRFNPLTTGNFWISRRPTDHPGDWTYNTFFSGLLDEIAIYNRALSAEEIREVCEAGKR